MTLKIKYVKQTDEEIENEKINNLIEHFNKLAKEKGIKFKIKISYGKPHLVQSFWFFQNYSNHIVYGYEDKFTFIDELDEPILNEIKPILEELEEDFEVIQYESD